MASNPKPQKASHQPDAALDAVKGVLILFIVFGHMHAVQHQMRPVYNLIYIFHVAGFLLLPFLMPSPPLSWSFAFKRFVRYAVPFFWFFTASTVFFYLVYLHKQGVGLPLLFVDYLKSLLIASTRALDAASGLKLLWFLPALFTLTLFRALWQSSKPTVRALMLAATLAVTLTAGEYGEWRYNVPWGLLIAAFIFPAGILTEAFFQSPVSKSQTVKIMAPILAVALLALSWYTHVSVNIGDLTLHGIVTAPLKLAVFLATMLAVVWSILLHKQLLKTIPGLAFIGSLSLPVYLTHGLINQYLEISVFKALPLPPLVTLWLHFPMVVILSLATAVVLTEKPFFRCAFFPRDIKDLTFTIKCIQKLLGKPGHA